MPKLRQALDLKDKNTPAYRKKFIRVVLEQSGIIESILSTLKEEVAQILKSGATGDAFPATGSKLSAIEKQLEIPFGDFIQTWLSATISGNEDTAVIRALEELQLVQKAYGKSKNPKIIRLVDNFGIYCQKYPEFVKKEILNRTFEQKGTVQEQFIPFSTVDMPIGEKIVTISGDSLEIVKVILHEGIESGTSAKEISKNIQNYIQPEDPLVRIAPFDWVKKHLGAEGLKIISANKVPPGTMNFNAMRIARTELNMTFRRAPVDLHEGKPWVRGFNWNLSRSHRIEDDCDDWARGGPYDSDTLPDGHPYCMCFTTVALVPEDELGNYLR